MLISPVAREDGVQSRVIGGRSCVTTPTRSCSGNSRRRDRADRGAGRGTGHLVFTTVHANTVFDVLGRFLHMGVDAYRFAAALNGILTQRPLLGSVD